MSQPWPEIELREVCESIVDCVNKTAPVVEGPTPYRMIRTTNVKAGKIDIESVRYVTEETYKTWTRRQVPKRGDVILTREAPLGEVGMMRECDGVFLGQRLMSYRADPKKLDPHFLLYSLQADHLQGQIRSTGSGATVEHMRVPDAEKLKIRLAPLPTQRKIASILSAYDDLIENNTRRVRVLEQMARALYREWFVEYRYPGHEQAEWVEDEAGRRPQGWEQTKLGLLCQVMRSGSTPSRKNPEFWDGGERRWFKTKELDDGFLSDSEEKITDAAVRQTSAKPLPAGTILMAIYAAPTVGRLGILTQESSCNQAALGMYAKPEKASQNWLFNKLLELRPHLNSISQGAAQQNISKEKVAQVDVILPPRELIERFDTVSVPMMEKVRVLTSRNANLRRTRDLLLPRLVSGELDVSGLRVLGPGLEGEEGDGVEGGEQ